MVHYREASFWLEELMIEGAPCKTCARQVLDRLRAREGVIALRLLGHPQEPGIAVLIVKFHPDYIDIAGLCRLLERELGFPVREVVGEAARKA